MLSAIHDPQIEAHPFAMASGTTIGDGGIPVQRFQKVILRVGQYEHPRDKWKLNVDREKLQKYADTFSRMRANGVDVHAVKDHGQGAADHLGFLTDMFVRGDDLIAVHEFRGHEAIALAQRLPRTSVMIDPDFKDGRGVRYGEAIIHNSISQQPVVPGMHDEFTPPGGKIAASLLTFSGSPEPGEKPMSKLKEMAKALGLKDDASEDDVLTAISQAKKSDTPAPKSEEGDDKDAKAKAASAASATPAAKDPATMDPNIVELLATSTETLAASLVEKGCITPAVREKLDAILVGPAGNRNAKALSITAGGSKPLATAVYEALRDNKPVQTGEKTGPQSFSAADSKKGGTKDADDNLAASMISEHATGAMVF